MPTIGPRPAFPVDAEHNSKAERLGRAKQCLQNLKPWKRGKYPERPPMSATDEDLVRWIGTVNRGDRLPRHERETYALFSSWRQLVWRKEYEDEGRLLVLLNAIKSLEDKYPDDEEGDWDKRQPYAQRLRSFVGREYHKLPPAPMCRAEVVRMIRRCALNMELLPLHLRTGKGFKKADKQEAAGQQRLRQLTGEEAYGSE